MSKILSRVAEVISEDDGIVKQHIHSRYKFYKDSNGDFHNTDLTLNDSSSTIGNIKLMNKSIFSVGIRDDDNPTKFMGIRPDCNQSGSEQLEFTLNSVKLDGVSQTLNLSNDLVKIHPHGMTRHLIPNDKSSRNFEVEYNVDLAGVDILNAKYESSKDIVEPITTTFREDGSIPGNDLLTGLKFNSDDDLYDDISGTDDKKILFCIGQFNDEYILTGDYDRSEEFTDVDLTGYNTSSIYSGGKNPGGGSMYMKDAITFYITSDNISDVDTIFTHMIEDMLEATAYEETEGSGKYFLIGGKKVGGWYYDYDKKAYLAYFNTKPIPNEIKTLFKTKTFNDTSYIDITLADMITKVKNKFSVSIDTVTVDNTYYNIDTDFIDFKFDDLVLTLENPKLFDENLDELESRTTHSLQDLGNNKYKYTKYLTSEGILEDRLKIAEYIDTNINSGGDVLYANLGQFFFPPSSWSTVLSTGSWARTSQGTGSNTFVSTYRTGLGSSKFPYQYFHSEVHHKFDCSSISGTVTDLDLKLWGKKAVAFTGNFTQTNVRKVNYASGAFDTDTSVRDYAAPIYNDGATAAGGTTDAEMTYELNSTAKGDCPGNSFFAFVVISDDMNAHYAADGTYDSSASSGPGFGTRLAYYSTEETDGTATAPYLVVTASAATTENAIFLGANF